VPWIRWSFVVAAVVAAGVTAQVSPAQPPPGLTRAGVVQWQFEALLFDRFHTRNVAAHLTRGRTWNFGCAGHCAPLSYWSPFRFVFGDARRSSYHVAQKRVQPGAFGNYPILITVKGRAVACDHAERTFLITYGDAAGFSFACIRSGG
jgi:hypothetical protein